MDNVFVHERGSGLIVLGDNLTGGEQHHIPYHAGFNQGNAFMRGV